MVNEEDECKIELTSLKVSLFLCAMAAAGQKNCPEKKWFSNQKVSDK